jgi:ABC-type sugar transport system permease subunit
MAVILNQKMIGRTFFRAVFFIPVILSVGILQNLDPNFDPGSEGINDGSGENATDGLISMLDLGALFANMKIGEDLVSIVVSAINNVQTIVSRSGVQFLIFLTGLQSISPAIYESCQIDGATAWETFWKITLPMISPMLFYLIITGFIGAFKAYSDAVALFGTDLNTAEMNTIVGYVYDMLYGDGGGYPSFASAAAIILFCIVLTITCINLIVSKKHVTYGK